MHRFKSLLSGRNGVTGLSYAVIVGLIGVVAILAITQVGRSVSTLMSNTANRMDAVNNASGASSGTGTGGGGGGNAKTYSASFTNGGSIAAQCSSFNSWRATVTGTYTKVTLRGSGDPVGVSCNGAAANTLCQALNTGTSTGAVNCDGRKWEVYGSCTSGGSAPSISADAIGVQSVCNCPSNNDLYVVRPCHTNYGAMNANSCNASMPNATLSIVCE